MAASPTFIFVFLGSIFLALLTAVYPLSPAFSAFRPELVCLVIMYWVLFCPHHVGVGMAWSVGLLQDVVEDGVWGAHALALAFVAYLCLNAYQRLRSYSLQQQTLWVFVFVSIHQLFVNWFAGMEHYSSPLYFMIGSAMVTAIFWPGLILCMRRLQRKYRAF